MTLDKEGAYLKTKDTSRIIPTRPRDVYDVTGAGDMVLSTLAMTLAAGCDYDTAVELANIAGGIEVGKFGNKTVSIEEMIDEIVNRNRADSGKIRSGNLLIDELAWHRRRKKSVVFTNGCFDILHSGHIEFLKFCKSQGDVVVIGLNSDNSVKTIKGPERPINNQQDRAAVLAALEMVDYITVFEEPDPLNLIKMVKPDVLVKGRDWEQKGVIGREFIESHGGKVVLAPIVEGKSTSKTIEKMKPLQSKSK
jgi:D-beta-D-heptose 7-phosphate kinase/D-beta-D-heptose 1-phosphate adenosyltransferase